jgi:hypothetical protein
MSGGMYHAAAAGRKEEADEDAMIARTQDRFI